MANVIACGACRGAERWHVRTILGCRRVRWPVSAPWGRRSPEPCSPQLPGGRRGSPETWPPGRASCGGRVPSTRERGVCTPLADTPEHGPASPSSLRDAPRAGARFAQGNGVHAVGHAGDFLMIFLKKKKATYAWKTKAWADRTRRCQSDSSFCAPSRNFTCDPRPGLWDSLAVCWLHRARRAHPMFLPVFSVCPGNGVCLWN